MKVSIIVAISQNNVIGSKNKLPWYLPADLKRFKELTIGHHIIMGRKTHESVGKALPVRTNIVITRNTNYKRKEALIVHSLENALKIAKRSGESEAFVIGGGEIFKQALPKADKIYMTKVKAEIPGDVFFPEFNESEWKVIFTKAIEPDEKNKYAYEFSTLERKKQVRS